MHAFTRRSLFQSHHFNLGNLLTQQLLHRPHLVFQRCDMALNNDIDQENRIVEDAPRGLGVLRRKAHRHVLHEDVQQLMMYG